MLFESLELRLLSGVESFHLKIANNKFYGSLLLILKIEKSTITKFDMLHKAIRNIKLEPLNPKSRAYKIKNHKICTQNIGCAFVNFYE